MAGKGSSSLLCALLVALHAGTATGFTGTWAPPPGALHCPGAARALGGPGRRPGAHRHALHVGRGGRALRSAGAGGAAGLRAAESVVLDFEGVICDTFSEVSRAAYRAALAKWPDTMGKATDVTPREAGVRSSWVGGKWSTYEEDTGDDIPRWLEEKLRQVRPVIQGNAEVVLASRLCVSEALAARRSDRGRRPLTAGEIISNWDEMKDILYLKCGAEEGELAGMFEEERTAWRSADEAGWMSAVQIYPDVARALRRSAGKFTVLSTELDAPTARAVLAEKGVEVDEERIVDCRAGVGVSKADALVELLGRGGMLHYVEDQTATLQQMAGDLRLAQDVNLYFAEWGHSTSRNKARVAAWPRVRTLTPFQLGELLRAC